MLPYYEFGCRSLARLDIWCGFEKWFDAADNEAYNNYDGWDERELEFDFVPSNLGVHTMIFPKQTDHGTLRRYAKHLRSYLEFDDSKIKGRQYHSRRATYWRNRRKKEFIAHFREWFEREYNRCMETCPDKIEPWIVELMNRKD